jgi:hypothetical protein
MKNNNAAHLGKYVVVNNVPHKFINGKLVALSKKG